MTRKGKQLGAAGEAAAADFLTALGYTILEKNFQTKSFEIDIIAKDPDFLCFVEVKTRSGLKKGLPRESITPAKQHKIVMGAQFYLKQQQLTNQRVRFDVVEVLMTGKVPQFNLIKNAFTGD